MREKLEVLVDVGLLRPITDSEAPEWMMPPPEHCWHLLTQTDKSASERMPL